MYEEFITVCGVLAIYFLIISFVQCRVNLIFEDCPEIVMEDERENYECNEENSNNPIADDSACHPNITTIYKQQQSFQSVVTQVWL